MKRTDVARRPAVNTVAGATATAPPQAARPGAPARPPWRPAHRVTATMCAVAAVASLALTACTADGGTSARTARASVAGAAAARPELGWAEDLRISDAEQHLITQCMKAHGFRFWDERRPSLAESRPLGYVQDDVRWARTYGYGSRILAAEDRARLGNPNLVYRRTLSADRQKAYDLAMDGGREARVLSTEAPMGGRVTKQSGGCAGDAEKALYGDPAAWFAADTTVSNLRPLYVGRLLKDGQFTRAVRAWARCMRDAGRPYADPAAARQATREHSAQQSPAEEARTFAAETRVAVADATCARTTSLRSVGQRREAHYVAALTGGYGKALDAYARMKRLAFTRAERIVPART
ncbi:hypothetical protein OG802_01370 [Streptomyces sp. NBC_00704]|uniref:hypothetical protein n=1 Tax=Streptomyces sp. NBC_00704 TaxID=2975809 RepID=UPI002E38007D|nr:hypothetical protein [Streptomyces sp. NBC_00704]